MSNEQIRLLESIRDGVHMLGDKLGGQIGETNAKLDQTNARLGMVESGLGARIDEVNAKLESGLGDLNRQLEVTNQKLDTLVAVHSDSSIVLSGRADSADRRITSLEHRVDKLEEAG